MHPYDSDGLITMRDSRRIVKNFISSNIFAHASCQPTILPWKLPFLGSF